MSQCCRWTSCFYFDVTTCNVIYIYWRFRRICYFFFWDMMLWSLVYIHWHFIGIPITYTDDGQSRFVQVGQCQPNCRCLIPEHNCLILNISVNMHHPLTGSNLVSLMTVETFWLIIDTKRCQTHGKLGQSCWIMNMYSARSGIHAWTTGHSMG
jgi:hypothetical protein